MRHWERRVATGANAVLVAVFVVAAIQLGVDAFARVAPRWDLSEDRSASLRPETLAVLSELHGRGQDLRITAFSAQQKDGLARSRDRQLRDFLRELEAHSSRVQARFVDFDRDRLTAEQLGVDRYGAVVLELGTDRVDLEDRALFRRSGPVGARVVGFIGEGAFVAGIERLLAARTRQIYALQGHGELAPFDRGLGELHGLAEVLSTVGLRTRALDLLAGQPPVVPDDAAAVLILGPRAGFPPAEQAAIRDYLRGGGGVLLALEPGGVLPGFVEELGLLQPAGIAMDPRSLYPWEDRPLLRGRRHPIGLSLGELSVVAGHASALRWVPVDGVTASPVLGTSAGGWLELGTERPARFHPDVDESGPLEIAWAVEVGEGRMLAAGDLDLFADPLIDEGPGNRTFAGAAVRWVLGEDRVSGAVGAPHRVRRVVLTPTQLWRLRIGLLGLWPLTILAVGAGIRWSRSRG